MYTLVNLAIKNIISRKSSAAIVLFISFSIALLVLSNSVFDSTEYGIEDVFKNSFTGDFVIRPKANVPLSLFGDETPVTGQLSKIENLVPYDEVKNLLQENENIKGFVPQITGTGFAQYEEISAFLYIFGVDSETYLNLMPSIKIIEGSAFKAGQKGVLLCKNVASLLNVSCGQTIQFTVADGPTFRIRAVPVCGIYEWKVPNDNTMNKFCIMNPETVREIMDIAETVSDSDIEESKTSLLTDFDFDNLFEDALDTQAVKVEILDAGQEQSDEVEITGNTKLNSTSWNFIIGCASDSKKTDALIRSLNRTFRRNGWEMEAVSWRQAAGRNAMYLYWMRIIFNVGILIILGAGFIVVNNALVINVLDRISEIGTMRAIGSSKIFVALLFMFETLLITVFSGATGAVLGSLASVLVSKIGIGFSNAFIVQLFGGTVLVTKITFKNIQNSFFLAALLGIVGWIYPLKTALKVSPVSAMNGEKR